MSRNSILDYLQQKFPIPGNFDLACASLSHNFDSILDVGLGNGGASMLFALSGRKVSALGLSLDSYGLPESTFKALGINVVESSFEEFEPDCKFDAVWMSHVLEHTPNPGLFLKKARELLNPNGILFVLVPPYSGNLVGGHITNGWNMGQLMYNLICSGFDIKKGRFIKHGYNLCAAVEVGSNSLADLRMDAGDLELMADLWPVAISQGCTVNDDNINWEWPAWMLPRLRDLSQERFDAVESSLEEAKMKYQELYAKYEEVQALKDSLSLRASSMDDEIIKLKALCELKDKSNKQLVKMLKECSGGY